jgi:hypothetical protein
VARVLANDAENVLPLDDAARFTLPLDGCSNFHEFVSLRKWLDLEDKKTARGARVFSAGARCAKVCSRLDRRLSMPAVLPRTRITSGTSLLGKKRMPASRIFLPPLPSPCDRRPIPLLVPGIALISAFPSRSGSPAHPWSPGSCVRNARSAGRPR